MLALFLVSGATGLVYEVAWTRLASLVFGSTALAAGVVLAAFMAGLAIGSRFFGKRIDRRGEELRTYGLLEIGIAFTALLVPVALDAAGRAFVVVYRDAHPGFWTMSLVRFAFSFVILIVPTALMGGTLPVLVRWWSSTSGEVGRSVGRLYAINTLGAMAGCVAAGFWLLASYGVSATIAGTAVVNAGLGLAAVVIGVRRRRTEMSGAEDVPAAASAEPEGAEAVEARFALVALGISGFLALAYEVAWTRVLLYVLSASIHAFTVMLGTFLAGLALGSLVLGENVDRRRGGLRLFGALEIGIGAAALVSIALLHRFPDIHDALIVGLGVRTWRMLSVMKFLEAALVVFVPTFLMGMTFPLASRLVAPGGRRVGSRIGTMIAVNTLGAVLGSFAAGFVLVPLLGTQGTIVALALGNGALGGALLAAAAAHRREAGGAGAAPPPSRPILHRIAVTTVPVAALAAAATLLPANAFLPVFGINQRGGEITYCREGVTGTVTIHRDGDTRLLSINGADVAGTTFMLRTTQKLQAHIPLLLHPDPRRVLQVGLGSGETARSILGHPVERLVGCDISPEVIEAGAQFGDLNRDVYAEPRLHIVIEDAKNYVTTTEETFDLILNDSVHPLFRGSSDLYSIDYFLACRERLADGGMMSSWIPTALLTVADLKMLLHTFQLAFPKCTLWMGTNTITRNALLLGWKDDGPLEIDFRRVASGMRRNPVVAADLAEVLLGTPFELLDCFMMGPDAIRAWTGNERVNSYDRAHLEFSAARALAAGDRQLWAMLVEEIVQRREPVLPYLVDLGDDPETVARVTARFERREAATDHVLAGLVHELWRRQPAAEAEWRRALEVHPNDPIASFLLARDEAIAKQLAARVAADEADAGDLVRLARMRREEGALEEARDLYEQAVQADPGQARAWRELAGVAWALGDGPGARAAADRALDLDPRYAAVRLLRARTRLLAGDVDGARADLERVADEVADGPAGEEARRVLAAAPFR